MIPLDRNDKLPPWIGEEALVLAKQNESLLREVEKQSFAIAYEPLLEAVSSGTNLTAFCRDYHLPISPTRYRAWLMRDPQRFNAFRLAQKIGAESIEDDLIRISDGLDPNGTPTLDDVARSKLRIDTRKYVLQVQDKDRYGDVKQVNSTIVTIDEERARSMSTSEIKAMLVKRLSDTSVIEDVLDNMAEDSSDDS